MKIGYLSNERCVKTFIIREKDVEHLLKSRGKIHDEMKKLSGEMITEVQILGTTLLIVVAFENRIIMSTWKALVNPVVLNDVETCKMLVLQEETPETAAKLSETIQASVREHQGIVLKTRCCTMTEYRLMVYFSRVEDMHKWEETMSLT